MEILSGNLVLNVETGSCADERWQFDVKVVNGVRVYGNTPVVPPRLKGIKRTNGDLPKIDKFLDMKPREYEDYLKMWHDTYNPRIVGGRTTLRSGDYLEVYEEKDWVIKIWQGVLALAEVECSPYEYNAMTIQIGVDVSTWENIFAYEMPATLYTDMGIARN